MVIGPPVDTKWQSIGPSPAIMIRSPSLNIRKGIVQTHSGTSAGGSPPPTTIA